MRGHVLTATVLGRGHPRGPWHRRRRCTPGPRPAGQARSAQRGHPSRGVFAPRKPPAASRAASSRAPSAPRSPAPAGPQGPARDHVPARPAADRRGIGSSPQGDRRCLSLEFTLPGGRSRVRAPPELPPGPLTDATSVGCRGDTGLLGRPGSPEAEETHTLVVVCWGRCKQNTIDRWLLSNWNLFSLSGGWKSKVKALVEPVTLYGETRGSSPGVFYRGADPIYGGSALMTYSPPEAPPPSSLTLGVGTATYEFGEGTKTLSL